VFSGKLSGIQTAKYTKYLAFVIIATVNCWHVVYFPEPDHSVLLLNILASALVFDTDNFSCYIPVFLIAALHLTAICSN
jgi:hypothetical protein